MTSRSAIGRACRRAAILAGCLSTMAPAVHASEATVCRAPADWPAYRRFVDALVSADGRVVDVSTPVAQTTSEGQSYALFFALVANDRATFARVLRWTREHLMRGPANSAGDAAGGVTLAAWQWGRKQDGNIGVLDSNAAADADLWLAYDLIEAGRLWHEPAYAALGRSLATRIAQEEVVELQGLGAMLLPGPRGFRDGALTRLNPSYLPLPLLRALAVEQPSGPWSSIADHALTLVKAASPMGFAPDWAAWRDGRLAIDPKAGDIGSYDAIRVYLWAGLAAHSEPHGRALLAALGGMRAEVAAAGFPPERVATSTGTGAGEGPLAYWGALAPYFAALGDTHGLTLARAHLASIEGAAPARPPSYYDRALGLFGTGFIDGRYRFDANGRVVPKWRKSCD